MRIQTHISDPRLISRVSEFRDKHQVPALGAGLLSQDGRLDVAVVGDRVRDGHDPATVSDRWHIGSCGKSITAALWGILAERGEARWDATLLDLFPDLADRMDPGWGGIGIKEVFASQAGLAANMTDAARIAAATDRASLRDQRTQVAAAALADPPNRPGRFLYSNLGYIIIGAAVERITGLPFEEALQQLLLAPLGISSGGFGPPLDLQGHSGRTLALGRFGAIDLGRGGPIEPDDVDADNPAVMSPAGRLHLTLEDWAKFQRVFLGEGGGFLRPDTVATLLTPASGRGQRQALGWAPAGGRSGVSFGQHGSNTYWVATALIDATRERTAMVVTNDGRPSMLKHTASFAIRLLSDPELRPEELA